MKTNMKIASFILHNTIATVFLVGTVACGSQEIFTKDTSEELNEEKFDKRKDARDAQFMVDAAEIFMEEIGLAKLAQDKGTTSPIKELGRTIESDHQSALDDLTTLAKRKNVTIPNTITDQGDDSYRLLNQKTGEDFNQSYANLMVKKHESAIEIFEKAANKSKDKQIKEWANSTLVILRKDLAESTKCLSEKD